MAVHEGWGVVPHLTIRDGRAAEAIDVYAHAFGAVEKGRHPAEDGKRLLHVALDVNGGLLMMHDDFPEMRGGQPSPAPEGVVLHLQVDDADAVWAKALENGFTVRFPLDDQFWGDRYGQVTDPFGHVWSIGATVPGGAGGIAAG